MPPVICCVALKYCWAQALLPTMSVAPFEWMMPLAPATVTSPRTFRLPLTSSAGVEAGW
jgi:hypothetical protein